MQQDCGGNSTFLVDKNPPGYSSKLNELEELLDRLLAEEDRKIVLFSEWTTMLDLIEPLLVKHNGNCVPGCDAELTSSSSTFVPCLFWK